MSLSQQQLQHLRSLNDPAAICAIARIESLEKAASDQELRERTQIINTEQRFHELQARVSAISFEGLQYKKQMEDLEAQVSSLVSKEKELLARHSDASIALARESSKAKRLEQQVDELHRDKVNVAFLHFLDLFSNATSLRRSLLLLRSGGLSSWTRPVVKLSASRIPFSRQLPKYQSWSLPVHMPTGCFVKRILKLKNHGCPCEWK